MVATVGSNGSDRREQRRRRRLHPTPSLWLSGATPLGSKKLTGPAATLTPNRPPERDGRGHSDLSNQGLAVTTVCEVGHSVIYFSLSLFWPLSGLGGSPDAHGGCWSVSWPRRPCAVAGHTARAQRPNLHLSHSVPAGTDRCFVSDRREQPFGWSIQQGRSLWLSGRRRRRQRQRPSGLQKVDSAGGPPLSPTGHPRGMARTQRSAPAGVGCDDRVRGGGTR